MAAGWGWLEDATGRHTALLHRASEEVQDLWPGGWYTPWLARSQKKDLVGPQGRRDRRSTIPDRGKDALRKSQSIWSRRCMTSRVSCLPSSTATLEPPSNCCRS